MYLMVLGDGLYLVLVVQIILHEIYGSKMQFECNIFIRWILDCADMLEQFIVLDIHNILLYLIDCCLRVETDSSPSNSAQY